MKFSAIRLALAATLLPACLSLTTPAIAHDSDVGAAIAGGIVGLAAGAALSSHHHHDKTIYYPSYAPPYPAGGYNPYFNQSFSPNPGIVCYPAQRACYHLDGGFAGGWTARTFGY